MKETLPNLPLGISDFVVLREAGANYLYVDKTRHLAELLASGKYLFLARPRRFGKSLLCSTMHSLYEGRRDLFAGLAIEPEWDWSQANPVVHVSLTDIGAFSPEHLHRNLLKLVTQQAQRNDVEVDRDDAPLALRDLVRAIREKTGRRVVVIVDEYEKPVHDHLSDPALALKMRDVLASFYGALKGCDGQLEKLFITGIGRMVKTSIFSELNQMRDMTLGRVAAEVCGYTEAELHERFAPYIGPLARRNDIGEAAAWERLRDRYNGYWWGQGEKVYNPWAILNCFADGQFGNYWWASGTPGMLVTLAETLKRPDGDLEGVQAGELALLFDMTQPTAEPLLWQSGYLTVKSVSGNLYTLGFPNAEVRESWYAMMLGHFMGGPSGAGQTAALIMLEALNNDDRAAFAKGLTALFASIPGELHVEREAYYHSVFFAALSSVGAEIIPESRTDKGRLDAVLTTERAVYVIEFKLGSPEAALAQIERKRYYEPYLGGNRRVVLLGAGGFSERDVRCVWKDVE